MSRFPVRLPMIVILALLLGNVLPVALWAGVDEELSPAAAGRAWPSTTPVPAPPEVATATAMEKTLEATLDPDEANTLAVHPLGFFGMVLQDLSDSLRAALEFPIGSGTFVADVASGSPADRAGLRFGDIIRSVNDDPVDGCLPCRVGLGRIPPGKEAVLAVTRAGQPATFSAVAAPHPGNPALEAVIALLEKAPVGRPETPMEPLLTELESVGKEGNVIAAYAVAHLLRGDGKPDDKAVPRYLENLERSAAGGFAVAQHAMGYHFSRGDLVKRDLVKATDWFRRAAMQNHAGAMVMLAFLLETEASLVGKGEEIAAWYKRAAEQGLCDAQYSLAVRYALGKGVTLNRTEALRWYLVAQKSGEPQDPDLKRHVERILGVFARTMPADETAKAQAQAARFIAHANYSEYVGIMDRLTECFEGLVTP